MCCISVGSDDFVSRPQRPKKEKKKKKKNVLTDNREAPKELDNARRQCARVSKVLSNVYKYINIFKKKKKKKGLG